MENYSEVRRRILTKLIHRMNTPTDTAQHLMIFPEKFRRAALQIAPSQPGDPFGAFEIPAALAGRGLHVIACDGRETGWEHASVSLIKTKRHTPTWREMDTVKRLFWPAEACVVQFHVPRSQHININPGVLHLWRPVNQSIPLPPPVCV